MAQAPVLPKTARAKKQLSTKFKLTAKERRRAIKRGALLLNVVVIAFIVFFVLNSTKATSAPSVSASAASLADINPLDQASSADIALTIAQASNLPEYTAVANQAQTAAANQAMASDTDNVVSKPEVVTTALKSRADIVDYTSVSGDTIASLAQKFGVTSSSIMWSNGIGTNALNPGQHLFIPPVNGVIYTVKAGDTPASLAQKYNANQQQIIAYNDAELSGLKVGEQIIIPDGKIQAAAPSSSGSGASGAAGASGAFPWGSGPVYGYNGYDFGYCTWYVATQVAVPSNWGNASSWAYYAGMSGWNVSTAPTPGSIAQTALAAGGEGHVAVVEAVNGDQVEIKDMNNYGDGGGWDRVGSAWVSAATFQHFITP